MTIQTDEGDFLFVQEYVDNYLRPLIEGVNQACSAAVACGYAAGSDPGIAKVFVARKMHAERDTCTNLLGRGMHACARGERVENTLRSEAANLVRFSCFQFGA